MRWDWLAVQFACEALSQLDRAATEALVIARRRGWSSLLSSGSLGLGNCPASDPTKRKSRRHATGCTEKRPAALRPWLLPSFAIVNIAATAGRG
jgi:hypothetical protein